MTDDGLTLEGIAIAAGPARLLDGLGLTVAPGELVGLSGPSGLGKSTLLRVVAGLIDPVEGRIRLHGRDPIAFGWPAFRRRVVHMAQRPVILDCSVRDNLARPFTYHVVDRAFPDERARALMHQLGIAERLEQAARTLSVGQQQRVALARALLVEPEFLLLDEPTSALDPESSDAVEKLVREQVDDNQLGGLVVSHDRAQLERWCSRVVDLAPFAVTTQPGRAAS